LTGNLVVTGREGKVIPKSRTGPVETHELTNRGKTKIRRAIECAADRLSYFVTLTFAPAMSKLNSDGTVNHPWAKSELHRFLDALTKTQIRRHRSFDYLWVAELQKNGNIHFHLLWNQFFPIKALTRLWKQANNSVDVKALQNVHHAKRYVMKYISKSEEQFIKGNRYAISSGLRAQMQAMTYMVDDDGLRREITSIVGTITEDINATGGFVNEWGFSLPMPERPRRTPCGIYPGVPRTLAPSLLDILLGEVPF
jgi:hypothetical protein